MTATISITDKGKTITYHAHHMRDQIDSTACSENDWTPERNYTFSLSTRRIELNVNIKCSPILLLLSGVLALLKIMGLFPYS